MPRLSPMIAAAARIAAFWLLTASLVLAASPEDSSGGEGDGKIFTLLTSMVEAVHQLNYEGTLVYQFFNKLETLQITHTVNENGERERLISLNGVPKQVIRDNASVVCINPQTRSVSVGNRLLSKGFQAMLALDVQKLSGFYQFSLAGKERIAGRGADVVLISPLDGYRYGYRLYLDQETHLPLKTQMLDPRGQAVSQLMFTSIRIDDALKDELNGLSVERDDYQWEQGEQKKSQATDSGVQWSFSRLPPGFEITLETRGYLGSDQKEVEHLVLSDGLASVSVYLEKVEGLKGGARMGSINAFGEIKNGVQVTAIGEVPEKTVMYLVQSLQTPGQPEPGEAVER